jgi:hypothetical protein
MTPYKWVHVMADVKTWLLSTIEQFVYNCGDLDSIVCQDHHLKTFWMYGSWLLIVYHGVPACGCTAEHRMS